MHTSACQVNSQEGATAGGGGLCSSLRQPTRGWRGGGVTLRRAAGGFCLWRAQPHRSGGHRTGLLLLLRHKGCLLSMPHWSLLFAPVSLWLMPCQPPSAPDCASRCVRRSAIVASAAAAEVCPTLPCVQVVALPSLEPLQQFSLAACLGFAWSWQEDAFPSTSLHSLCALAPDGQLAMVRQLVSPPVSVSTLSAPAAPRQRAQARWLHPVPTAAVTAL